MTKHTPHLVAGSPLGQKLLDQLMNPNLKFAITGKQGTGKSSFLPSLLELNKDKDSIEVIEEQKQ